MIRCKKEGHFYDGAKFFECPFCGITFKFDVINSHIEDNNDETILLDGLNQDENTIILGECDER